MKKLKLYLDNCCFNRPYDDQIQQKIYIETEAKLFIQREILDGKFDLVWSYILDYENSANPDKEANLSIQLWEKVAKEIIIQNDEISKKAKKLNSKGFGIKDSLHIACAIEAKVNYFLTVDKGILTKRDIVNELFILNPVDFIELEEDL